MLMVFIYSPLEFIVLIYNLIVAIIEKEIVELYFSFFKK